MEKGTFNRVVETWGQHVRLNRYQGDLESYLDCDEYRFLVSKGMEVLPLIRDLFASEGSEEGGGDSVRSRLVDLVTQIVGADFVLPEEIYGNISAMENFTRDWLEANVVDGANGESDSHQ